MSKSLDDILNNEPEAEAIEEPQVEQQAAAADEHDAVDKPEAEAKPDAGPKRGQDGKFLAKEAAKPDAPEGKPEDWSFAAYKDEKEKRKDLERRVADYERQQQEFQRQQPQAKPQYVDPLDDPKGFNDSLESRIKDVTFQITLNTSERFARQEHGEEVLAATNAWLMDPANQQALQQAKQSNDPWGDGVKAYKRSQAMAEIGEDPQAYRERVKAEIREQLEAEMSAQSQPSTPAQSRPSNFSAARNAGKRSGPTWSGPASLDNLLG
jgi:hypothetical protein